MKNVIIIIIGGLFGYLNGVFLLEPMYEFPVFIQRITVWINGIGIGAWKFIAGTLISAPPQGSGMEVYKDYISLTENLLKLILAACWIIVFKLVTWSTEKILKILVILVVLNSIGYYINNYVRF